MSYTPYHLVIFGPQGSGKGTQAKILANEFGLVYVGMGELLRDIAGERSAFGQRVRRTIAAGHLIPDAMCDEIMTQRLASLPPSVGFILDGYPRTIPQIDGFRTILTALGRLHPQPVFINLQVPRRELLRRLRLRRDIEHREDETEEAISRRLKIYEQQTKPVLEHIDGWAAVINVNGDQSITAVTNEIKQKLEHAER